MKRLLFVCATLVLGAVPAHAQAVQVDPAIAAYQKTLGRLRQHQQRRLRHDEQPDDALGGDLPQALPERQDPDRGQGLVDGAAGAHRGHRAVRPDVARDEARPRSTSSRRSTATSRPQIRTSVDALAVFVNKDNPIK